MREVLAYATSRLLTLRVTLLIGGTVLFATLSSQAPSASNLVYAALLAGLLTWQFRIWDDLADRVYDRAHHPDRVLSGSAENWPFRTLAASLSLPIGVLIVAGRPWAWLAAYVTAVLIVGALYYLLPSTGESRPAKHLRTHVLLGKYAVFAFLCAQPPLRAYGFALIALGFFLLCIFEIVDDRELREETGARAVLAMDLAGALAASFGIFKLAGLPS